MIEYVAAPLEVDAGDEAFAELNDVCASAGVRTATRRRTSSPRTARGQAR